MTTTIPRYIERNPDTRNWRTLCKVDVPEGESGDIRIERFTIEDKPSIYLMRLAMQGRPCSPGTYTRITSKRHFWMSDTPAEIDDHREVLWKIHQAPEHARILINGLGLGMILNAALAQSHVAHIDVVEINSDVIALTKDHYQAKAQAANINLTIHQQSAFDIQWPTNSHWDIAWHDIWPEICEDNLPEYTKLKRKYARRASWQGCCAEDTIRAEMRRTRNAPWRRY